MEMNNIVFKGYQRLAADVITSAWDDVKTNAEIEIIKNEKVKLDLIDKDDLTKVQRLRRNFLAKKILLDGESRYFFEQRNYELWADTAEIDFDMLFEAYVAYIHKPLAAKVG